MSENNCKKQKSQENSAKYLAETAIPKRFVLVLAERKKNISLGKKVRSALSNQI